MFHSAGESGGLGAEPVTVYINTNVVGTQSPADVSRRSLSTTSLDGLINAHERDPGLRGDDDVGERPCGSLGRGREEAGAADDEQQEHDATAAETRRRHGERAPYHIEGRTPRWIGGLRQGRLA